MVHLCNPFRLSWRRIKLCRRSKPKVVFVCRILSHGYLVYQLEMRSDCVVNGKNVLQAKLKHMSCKCQKPRDLATTMLPYVSVMICLSIKSSCSSKDKPNPEEISKSGVFENLATSKVPTSVQCTRSSPQITSHWQHHKLLQQGRLRTNTSTNPYFIRLRRCRWGIHSIIQRVQG
jgi:hypothetical protein